MSEYMSTPKMAQFIGYSKDYLMKHREVLFFHGTHYFTRDKRINWKVSEMIAWIENKNMSKKAKEILDMVS